MSLVYTVALVLTALGKYKRYKQNTYLLPGVQTPALYLPTARWLYMRVWAISYAQSMSPQ